MSKAEEFIKLNTKTCSNINLSTSLVGCDSFAPWLTTDQARKAVEIAREEVIEKVCEFLENELCCYINAREFTIKHQRLENDLKQAMKDE